MKSNCDANLGNKNVIYKFYPPPPLTLFNTYLTNYNRYEVVVGVVLNKSQPFVKVTV